MSNNSSRPESAPPSFPAIEYVTPSLTSEWLDDGRIVVYALKDVQRATVDSWIEAFRADILAWPLDRPFLVIHDFSSKNLDASPYARQRAKELFWLRPELKGKAAIILPATIVATMIRLFVAIAPGKETPRITQVFASREKALEWLLG